MLGQVLGNYKAPGAEAGLSRPNGEPLTVLYAPREWRQPVQNGVPKVSTGAAGPLPKTCRGKAEGCLSTIVLDMASTG